MYHNTILYTYIIFLNYWSIENKLILFSIPIEFFNDKYISIKFNKNKSWRFILNYMYKSGVCNRRLAG